MADVCNMHPIKRDKGWAWIVLMGAFVVCFLETGVVKALGVLLPTLRQQLVTDTWLVGLCISLKPGVGAITCPFGGAMSKRLSPRVTVMTFGLFAAVGLIASSLVSSVYMLMLTTVLTGFSIGAEAVVLGELASYFDEYYDVAISVSRMGLSLGVIIMPPLTQTLLDIYGWRGTMMILGAMSLHLVVCGLILRPVWQTSTVHDYADINNDNQTSAYPGAETDQRSTNTSSQNIMYYFDFVLFKDINFISMLLYNVGSGYCFVGWLIYLVPHAVETGFSTSSASYLATFGGVGSLVANILYPFVKMEFANKHVLYSMSVIGFIAVTIDPIFSVSRSYIGLAVSSATFGFGREMGITSVFAVLKEATEQDKITNAVLWLHVAFSIGSISSGFLSGWIFDNSGSYTPSFLVLGAMLLFGLSLQFIIDIQNLIKGTRTKYNKVSSEDPH